MEKKICSYEALFTLNANLPEEELRATVDKYVSLISDNSTEMSVNEWGKRRLAYPINDKNEGYYVLVNFEAESAFPAELERIFGITDGIMRSIVIRHEDKKVEA